ncbi:ABC transporter substrate-binding protein [Thauera chlorobenzoica]|uniref:Hydroxybenzoate transporter, inner-membrane translocator n=1 Tax=Thauera chlorobenzoica TaxID=96773 RepID=A0A1H5Z3E7_9RHOO|nr:ABC transporter substrate-binding protein [Thauera chlorobenzoica]APR05826.1 hydroxybenzoate transporter, inner-membrane translocator [Thauera chlorobenzoica]SEG31033.1 amino acid/amide ABC transporter substrate-binding protein, HAAT family [Thauera chlorobenzoica]
MPKLKTVAVSLALSAALGAHAAAPIKVGMALDISGPFATIGAETRDGFNLAIEKLGGKLGGVETEFLQTDFAGNPEQANQLVARYLQRDKIDFFTGPVASNSALAVGPALFAAKVPFLSSNPGPSLFAGKQCNPYFFGVSYQNDTYDEAAGKVANEKGFKNMVLIAPNYPAGKDHIGGFKRLYKGAVKEEIYTKVGQIDYAAEIAQIRAAKPDAVFVFLPAAMGINFIKQYVGSGLKDIALIAPGFTADQDVIEAVGEPTLGMLNTAHWAHDLDVPANKAFVEAFGKKYNGRYPTVYAAQAYDVVMAMDAAVREVGGKVADREAVVAALKKANFKSVRGEFKYGPNNFPVQNYYLRVVDKDASGKLTNKLVGTVLEKHQDAYVGDCKQ